MAKFEASLENFARDFKSFTDPEKNLVIETILTLCGPEQLRFLSEELHSLVKRDFIKFLPTELAFNVVKFLDYKTFSRCCLVSRAWNRILSNSTEVWTETCKRLGVVGQKFTKTIDWKLELRKGLRRIKRFRRYRTAGFAKRDLDGHTERVTAFYYKDGLLASGEMYIQTLINVHEGLHRLHGPGPEQNLHRSQGPYDVMIAEQEKQCFTIYYTLLHIFQH
jgi:F-box/WD-40 domain protein 2